MLDPEIAEPAADVREALSVVPDAALHAEVDRALALASFSVPAERDEPYRATSFGAGAPERPQGPLLPVIEGRYGELMQALERLQQALVFRADRSQFTDANLNATVYLQAAGRIDRAAERLVELAAGAA